MSPCTCMVDASAPAFCSSDFAQQGRVRTKTVKRVSREIIEKYYTRLTLDFHTNKRICDEIAQIPSKKLRNKIAGFITHLMKRIQVRTAHFNQPPFNMFSFHSFKKISFLNMGWRWCATCPINAIATVCVHDGSLGRLACAMPMFCRFVAALASNLWSTLLPNQSKTCWFSLFFFCGKRGYAAPSLFFLHLFTRHV